MNEQIKKAYVYVIGTIAQKRLRTYVGWTFDVQKRLAKHNSGQGAKSTKGYQWKLLYYEEFETKQEAMSREWYLKRDKALRAKIRSTINI